LDESLIIGGDLNFTVNKDEMWGVQGWEDKLSNFFTKKFEACKLVDVEFMVLKPTWYNN
jgi:hypothetical protein